MVSSTWGCVKVRGKVRVRREGFYNVNDPGIELELRVVWLQKVPPDQLCPRLDKAGPSLDTA